MKKIDFSNIAIMNIHYFFYTMEHFLDTMAFLDMKKIDLWAGYPHLLLEKGCEPEVKAIRQSAESRGMEIVCCTPEQIRYPFNIASTEEAVRRRSVDYLSFALEMTAEMGAKLFQVVPGFGFFDQPLSDAWNCCRDSLRVLGEKAEPLDITVVVEPLQLVESNLIVDRFTAKKMLDEVDHPCVKGMVDTCHMAKKGETLASYFDLLGKDIRHIHLNDEDQVPWGEGNLPLQTYLDTLAAYDYEHYMTLEICSHPHHIEADDALRANVAYVKKQFGLS